ncbi:GntR family transcriptional regulator [Glycomyces halotolerans]
MGEALVWPERQTLADEAYTELKSRILQSVLEPGVKLSIDALAKRLEISQTPIREALARLESEGLVERRALVGYKVTPLLTREEFEDLFEMRLLLEPVAARRAAARSEECGPDVPAALRMLARTPSYSSDAKLSQLDFTEADQRFHNYVGEVSGSPMLARSIERLDAHLHLHRAYIAPTAIEETEDEHRAVAEAIIDRKPLAAEEAMRRHLENSRRRHAAVFLEGEASDGHDE